MKPIRLCVLTTFLLSLALPLRHAHAQAAPTARQHFQFSAFGGLTGTYTGLLGGKNLGITAGADLDLLSFHHFEPSIEVRGTFPIDSGHIDSQRDLLGGVKVARAFNIFHPYADFLIGRGQIDYQNHGFAVPPVIYLSSTTVVLSPGIGVDVDFSHHWSGKADFQYQSWDTPLPVGTIHPKALTAALVYYFDFNRHH